MPIPAYYYNAPAQQQALASGLLAPGNASRPGPAPIAMPTMQNLAPVHSQPMVMPKQVAPQPVVAGLHGMMTQPVAQPPHWAGGIGPGTVSPAQGQAPMSAGSQAQPSLLQHIQNMLMAGQSNPDPGTMPYSGQQSALNLNNNNPYMSPGNVPASAIPRPPSGYSSYNTTGMGPQR